MPEKLTYKELEMQVKILKKEVNQRRKAETALKDSEEKFRLLVESMSDGLGVQYENGVISFANETLCKMLGYSPDELIGKKIIDFVDSKNGEKIQKQMKRRKTDAVDSYELEFIRRENSPVPTIVSPRALFDSKGKLKGSFAVITDISKQKKEKQKLEKKVKERTVELEEMNTALRAMLRKHEKEKTDLEDNMLYNMRELVLPYLAKIKKSRSGRERKVILDILESNVNNITSPLVRSLNASYLKFTPTEIQVANLIKIGNTTKKIGEMLNLSMKTICIHRHNIRRKLGLVNKKENLRTRLMALQ